MKRVKVFAPGTVANIGCGFDVMGLTLDGVGDMVELTLYNDKKEFDNETRMLPAATCRACTSAVKNSSGTVLPQSAEKNVVTPAIEKMVETYMEERGIKEHFYIMTEILTKIRPGSGIGSSAASSAAAVYALNILLGKPFTDEKLVDFAMEGEKLISGTAHADNVGPAILGGVVFIRGYNPTDLIRLPVPEDFYCTVVHPHIMVSTKEARDMLPESVSRKDAIRQWGNVGGFVAGLLMDDMKLLGRSVEDAIAEPYRKKFIPGYDTLKAELLGAGLLGVNIAGSGPSVFALSDSLSLAERGKEIMERHFALEKIENEIYVTKVGKTGARVVE